MNFYDEVKNQLRKGKKILFGLERGFKWDKMFNNDVMYQRGYNDALEWVIGNLPSNQIKSESKQQKSELSITREQIIEDMKYAKYELKEAGYDDAATWWEGYIEALEFVLEYKNGM